MTVVHLYPAAIIKGYCAPVGKAMLQGDGSHFIYPLTQRCIGSYERKHYAAAEKHTAKDGG